MGKHEGVQKHEPRRLEFSKLIVILAIILWFTVNVFGMVMMAITQNLSPMVYVLASVDAVMGVICATYAYKAKAENTIKLRRLYNIDTSDLDQEIGRSEYKSGCGRYSSGHIYYDDAPMYEDASIV